MLGPWTHRAVYEAGKYNTLIAKLTQYYIVRVRRTMGVLAVGAMIPVMMLLASFTSIARIDYRRQIGRVS